MEIEYILSSEFKAGLITDSKALKEACLILCQELAKDFNEGLFERNKVILKRLIELNDTNFGDKLTPDTRSILQRTYKELFRKELENDKSSQNQGKNDKISLDDLPMELESENGKKYILMNTASGGLILNRKM